MSSNGMWPTEKVERNDRIVKMHVEDRMTLAAIGEEFGISRERVRQIVRRLGVPVEVTKEIDRLDRMVDRVEVACDNCGTVRRMIPSRARGRKYCSSSCHIESVKRTDRELIDHMRALGERLGRTPTAADLSVSGPPRAISYQERFGSLRSAQRLAGFEPNPVGAPRQITAEDVALMKRLQEQGATQTDIAEQLDISQASVSVHLRKAATP